MTKVRIPKNTAIDHLYLFLIWKQTKHVNFAFLVTLVPFVAYQLETLRIGNAHTALSPTNNLVRKHKTFATDVKEVLTPQQKIKSSIKVLRLDQHGSVNFVIIRISNLKSTACNVIEQNTLVFLMKEVTELSQTTIKQKTKLLLFRLWNSSLTSVACANEDLQF